MGAPRVGSMVLVLVLVGLGLGLAPGDADAKEPAAARILTGLPDDGVAPESLWYARVGDAGTRIYAKAAMDARVLTRKRGKREFAFVVDRVLRESGWLERTEGGFVRASRVEMLTPSQFVGVEKPVLPLAFVTRATRPRPCAPSRAAGARTEAATAVVKPPICARYEHLSVLAASGTRVETERGSLPRGAVRVIVRRALPAGVPVGARWVNVNLAEQTLTAYEGEEPVYATLISSGKTESKKSRTQPGLHALQSKFVYSDMHGEADDPYTVDRVPYTLYFHKGEALHGTYWHDRFGFPASHGCVNLSLGDARWLFAFAPPLLPEGAHGIEPHEGDPAVLWVYVEDQTPLVAPTENAPSGARDNLPRRGVPALGAPTRAPAHAVATAREVGTWAAPTRLAADPSFVAPAARKAPMNTTTKDNDKDLARARWARDLGLRDGILKLLSDDEVERVSTAETLLRLGEGEEYIDLQRLDEGVLRADSAPLVMAHVLRRNAVHADTWQKILAHLHAGHPGERGTVGNSGNIGNNGNRGTVA